VGRPEVRRELERVLRIVYALDAAIKEEGEVMDLAVKWGTSAECVVRPDRFGRAGRIELLSNAKEAPMAVLHWPDICMMPMDKDQARRLGAALIRVANSV
jgi:hypothetical protein